MISRSRTCLMRLMCIVGPTLFLTGCLIPTPPSPPPKDDAVAVALCSEWKGSLASWADADTEQTKDEVGSVGGVDVSRGKQEGSCKPYTGPS